MLPSGGEREMTKEDVLRESSEGDLVPGRYSIFSRSSDRSVIHLVASAPMPSDYEFSFFDPGDPQCREVLLDPRTTVSELFAIFRQWVPQVQRNISLIGNEILKRGCGVNDRDGLTDMTLLHYCCKAGAPGIGDAECAASFARQLLSLGAEPSLRSRWTNMNALHYAAYFDVPPLIRVVLQASQPGEVDSTCSDFDFGTALHIAASNLCISAVKCLLELGANPAFRNEKSQCPADVVPDTLDMPLEIADAAGQAKELRALLQEVLPWPEAHLLHVRPPSLLSDKACSQLSSMGLHLGDKVVIAGQKVGTLRFCGSTEFAGGLWAGVELHQPVGKNDGSVAGVQYFSCPNKHGIFAPLSKISKISERSKESSRQPYAPVPRPRRIDLARVMSKVNTGLSHSCSTSSSSLDSRQTSSRRTQRPHTRQRTPLRPLQERTPPSTRFTPPPLTTTQHSVIARSRTPSANSMAHENTDVHLGERVLVVGQRTGNIRFYGKTSFAPGFWLGIELDKPSGKNDGSVGGVRYFSCPPKHGVFAPPSRVQSRIHGSVDCLSELSSSRMTYSFTGIRRTLSTSSAIATQREPNRKGTRNRSSNLRRRWTVVSAGWGKSNSSIGPVPNSVGGTTSSSGSDGAVKLHLGMHVLLLSANEMGIIRYIGTADFAPGLWLGLELRSPKGRNDGCVGSRRYFSCRPGHGVLVRPSRVTYRGISGAKLVDECS
ncbi:CAP-Gly domain-containing linker protein 4-like isoform X1 [Triplophysa rosa]|uniref:CAP-Gly domain-containing linker protein 4-like isoform X1 n=2 Tax=Triplophysa rosa TaxID=992332 RepID=UPI00254630B9|nr:CAP-Gly domain-containing linker protein 4-like isoform X1 [Triplophysa rosa]